VHRGDHPRARLFVDSVGQRFGLIVEHVAHDHLGPFANEQPRLSGTLTACAA
jgi:hypothetical protein